MEANVMELRRRAERRLGEMMAQQPKAKPGGDMRAEHRVNNKPDAPARLAEAGIDKNLAHAAHVRSINGPPASTA